MQINLLQNEQFPAINSFLKEIFICKLKNLVMKTFFILFVLLVFSGIGQIKAQKLEKVWETSIELKTPESVLFDEERNVMYVANKIGRAHV